VADRFAGQRLQAGAAAQRGAGLVEGDVPVAANAQDLQVNGAGVVNSLLVLPAMEFKIGGPTIGNVRRGQADVDMVEQIDLHELAVALRMNRRQAHVLIEIERGDERKIEALLLVQADELPI